MAQSLHVTGTIRPEVSKQIDVNSRFSGRVIKVLTQPGDSVRAGQALAIVDSHDIAELQAEFLKVTAELSIAKAHEDRERQIYEENLRRPKSLVEAQLQFSRAKAGLQLAEADFKRIQALHKEKIAALKDFSAAEARLTEQKAAFIAAQSEFERQQRLYENKAMLKRDLNLAAAQTARAREMAETLRQRLIMLGMPSSVLHDVETRGHITAELAITAPSPGVITEQTVAIGEMVSPDKTLFTITDLSTAVVNADLPEVDLRYVRLGTPVEVTVQAYPDEKFRGTIKYISQQVNPDTRSVPIRASLRNTDLRLKSDMFAEIEVRIGQEQLLSCPRGAVQEHHGKNIAFVKTADGYQERVIEVGRREDDLVEIVSGLSEGEEVVTDGSLLMKTAALAPKAKAKATE